MIALSDKTFNKYLDDDMPLFVMFHAAFSGPCVLADPEFRKAANRAGNQIRFATFDLDGNPDTPERYNIRGVPEFILFIDGEPINPTVGALTCDQLLVVINHE